MDVYRLSNPEKVDEKMKELLNNHYNTIILSNEIAGFSVLGISKIQEENNINLEKYMLDDYSFEYRKSLFSMKPILMSSEIDDSRPTVIRKYSKDPTFVGVLSGKINTVYDLDEVLSDGK